MDSKRITLFANGCSHTAGSEIEFEYQGYCYEKAWPRWLADDMGWDWVNLSHPGNSNEQISRETIEWMTKNIEVEQKYQSQDIVAIIMWSGFNRFEVWSSADNRLKSVSGHGDNSWEAPELQELIKYRVMVDTILVQQLKSLHYIYVTAKFLESLGIKYYFMNALDTFQHIDHYNGSPLGESYKTIYQGYGDRRISRHLGFGKYSERFYEHMRTAKIPFSPYAKWGHYDEVGHKYWKDVVKDWIQKVDNV